MLQIVESRRIAFDTLRVAIDEEVDPVFALDDRLIDDQLFAVVPLKLGLETQDTQLGAAGCFLPGLGDLEASRLKLDDLIQILKPFVEPHKPVKILGNLCDQSGHEVVPLLTGGDVALRRRVPGIPQLPVDVELPGEVDARPEISRRIGKVLPGEIRVVEYAGSFFREAAVSVQPRAGRDTDEGKVRP